MSSGPAIAHAPAASTDRTEVVAFRARPDRFGYRALDRRLDRAGLSVASHVVDALDHSDTGVVHMPTVIAVLAVMAAEAALTAASIQTRTAIEVRTGGWIVGGPADAILFRFADEGGGGATVWDTVLSAACAAPIPLAELPDLALIVAEAEARLGQKPFPVYSVVPHLRPHGVPRATAARLRHGLYRRAADEGLCTAHEQALVFGAAIGAVVRREATPVPLLHLAAEAVVAGARLSPLPFAAG